MKGHRHRSQLAAMVLAAVCLVGCGQRPGDSRRGEGRNDADSAAEEPIVWEEGWAETDWDLQLAPCESEEVVEVGDEFMIFDLPTYKGFVNLEVTVCASDSETVLSRVKELQEVFVQTYQDVFGSKGALCSLGIRAGAPAELRREWTERYRDVMLRALNDTLPGTGRPTIRFYECVQRNIDYR